MTITNRTNVHKELQMATKAELISGVAERADADKKTTEAVLAAFFDHTAEAVKDGEKVAWPGFGTCLDGRTGSSHRPEPPDRRRDSDREEPLPQAVHRRPDERMAPGIEEQALEMA